MFIYNPRYWRRESHMTYSHFPFFQDCLNYNIEISSIGDILCGAIDADVGGVDLPYCMAKCLDMTGCRGVTYYHMTQSCQYHSCADVDINVPTFGVTLVRRLCISEGKLYLSFSFVLIIYQIILHKILK